MKSLIFIALVFFTTNIYAQSKFVATNEIGFNTSINNSSISIYKLSSSLLSQKLITKRFLFHFNELESISFDIEKFNTVVQHMIKIERPYIGFILFDSCGNNKFGDPVYGNAIMSSQEYDLLNFQRSLSPNEYSW